MFELSVYQPQGKGPILLAKLLVEESAQLINLVSIFDTAPNVGHMTLRQNGAPVAEDSELAQILSVFPKMRISYADHKLSVSNPALSQREADARAYYALGMLRVANGEDALPGQKFPKRARVRIADDLGPSMSHFQSGCNATVEYCYAQAFGGNDVTQYSLDIDNYGSSAWYYEHQLTLIEDCNNDNT